MKHRTMLLFVAALLLCMTAMQASAQRGMMMSPEERTKQLTDSLALNKEQSEKVLKVYQDTDKKRREMFEAGSQDRESRRESMRTLMNETNKKIEALLTEKQKTKFQDMMARRMQRRPMGMPPGPGGPPNETKPDQSK